MPNPFSLRRPLAQALLCAGLLMALPRGNALAFPNFYEPAMAGLMERFLQTEAGNTFARSILGPRLTRFNPAGSQEVINTLMNPSNQALADAFERRIFELNRSVEAQTSEHLANAPAELVAREAARIFALKPGAAPGALIFADGEAVSVLTAAEARRAEFVMGGKPAPVRVPKPQDLPAPPRGFARDSFEQFLQWEELTGIRIYREGTQFFGLPMAPVAGDAVNVQVGSDLPDTLRALFVRGDQVYWPKHPFNTSTQIPFADAAAQEAWPARLTASRSMVIWNKTTGQAFSLKAPTNHPHRTEMQKAKLHLEDDIAAGVYRSEYIRKVDARLGADPELGILPEIFSAAAKTGGNGFVVRDLTALQDGNYYLPALSIPFVGRQIARLHGVEFSQFWEANYARLLGRSKAKLLVRYGLQMETPNCQNMLIQLDRQMRPTGKLFFRDISDSQPVMDIARAIGQDQLIQQDMIRSFKIDTALNPQTKNSFWRMDQDPFHRVDETTLHNWMAAHDDAYVNEAMKLLGLDVNELASPTVESLNRYLMGPEAKRAFVRFHRLAN